MRQPLPTDIAFRSADLLLLNGAAEITQASKLLLVELEASLQASQRALLSHDVALMEQHTCEQIRLQRLLEALWSRRDAAHDPAFIVEMRAAQMRVLHLGRVLAALLVRAQRWQSMLSNLLAGSETSYVPPGGSMARCIAWTHLSGIPIANTPTSETEERKRCRA
jgi:hypothetical protein